MALATQLHGPRAVSLGTALIDTATEARILAVIDRRLSHCTVLSVAHRLQKIRHCDSTLVLDEGRVAEFGSLVDLLEQTGFFFRALRNSPN